MNPLRQTISNLFEAPMQNMSFVSYFQYINTNGKVTARSLMEIVCILATYIEEQEKTNEKNEANFKDIEGILAKLVDKKLDKKVGDSIDINDYIVMTPTALVSPLAFTDKEALRQIETPSIENSEAELRAILDKNIQEQEAYAKRVQNLAKARAARKAKNTSLV